MRERRVRAPWRAVGCAAAALSMLVGEAAGQDGAALVVLPEGRSVEMRAGERRGFSATLAGADAQYAWALDGAASGQGTRFEFRPTVTHVGRHEISVTALAGTAAIRHTWLVTVEGTGPPVIVRAAPSATLVRVPAEELLQFELQAEPATLTDHVTVRWTVDGAPMGEGSYVTLRVPASGSQRVRAVATSQYGGAVMREWQIVTTPRAAVAAPPPPARDVAPDPELAALVRDATPELLKPVPAKPRLPAAPQKAARVVAEPKKKAAAEPPRELARLTPSTEPPPPPPPPPPAPPAVPVGVTEDDVRALMFRYEQAWRTRNTGELRRIGHVETDEQENALAKYFATTSDLEVAVHVLELRVDSGHGTVRFTRRDRFRDPAGREVSKESPPIEKTIVRTPAGVRFSPRS